MISCANITASILPPNLGISYSKRIIHFSESGINDNNELTVCWYKGIEMSHAIFTSLN